MGETLDKGIAGECPKHKIAYTEICIQNDCFEKGLICPKCSPQSCIEKLGHKKMAVNDFYRLYINNIVNLSSRLILTINLILLGHIPIQNKTHYELFMTYQIGVTIIDFFGKLIILN